MSKLIICAIVIVILVVIYYYWRQESFGPCPGCKDYQLPRNGYTVINPYFLPYSATQCIGEIYQTAFTPTNTSDHVLLTN